MDSKTKYKISEDELKSIFKKADLGDIIETTALGDGMYNAIYKVTSNIGTFAIKIAPPTNIKVMTYEVNMLNSEIYWYDIMSKRTCVKVPNIIFKDTSRTIIPADYFIMEYIDGVSLNKLHLTNEEKAFSKLELCKNLASLHSVKNTQCGYVQNSLQSNWYLALNSFITNCIKDMEYFNINSKRAQKVLCFVNNNKSILEKVKCAFVFFDIWDLNIMAKKDNNKLILTWIDPERAFYGDPIVDFLCVDALKFSLKDKAKSISLYNSFAEEKINIDKNTEIRFALAMGYLAVILETEKLYRFNKTNIGWWMNTFTSTTYYNKCFRLLKKIDIN